ncbi:MAG: ankyrin repeat domain-containing protein [Gammaproteobacteria bacterium]|nr:ankyrin repeat domain-containing protein [Gammaproteobacteria bacterium]
MARLLVEAGADLAACTPADGATAAQVAAFRGHHDVGEYLGGVTLEDGAP